MPTGVERWGLLFIAILHVPVYALLKNLMAHIAYILQSKPVNSEGVELFIG